MNSKYRMMMLFIVTIGVVPSHAWSESMVGYCKTIYAEERRFYTIKTALHKATHIILPERLLGKPIVGNQDLWNVDGQGNHVFVKPNSKLDEGEETSLSLVNEHNVPYHFRLVRTDDDDTCVHIVNNRNLLSDIGNFKSKEREEKTELQSQITMLESKLRLIKQQSKEEQKQIAEKALQDYRQYIFTGYKWPKKFPWFGKNIIQDVWDDGRFTFIRVKHDHKELMTITGKNAGNEQILDYHYNDNNIYRISGVYDKIVMRRGKRSIVVKRTKSSSYGSY